MAFERLEERRLLSVGPDGPEFRVNSVTTSFQEHPAVAMDPDGDFVVTWHSYLQDGSGFGVYAKRYNAAGAAQGGEFQVNTFTTGHQHFPAVAIDSDGDFVITWQSGQDGDGSGVYAQRYNAAGAAQGGEFQVNTFTTSTQRDPAVAMDVDGDFVISWESFYQDGDGEGVYARRYNAAGVAQGGEFRVNSFTTGHQRLAAVAMDMDGDFVISWQSDYQDGSGYGVYARRYNAAGAAQGGEFQVNTFTTGHQHFPAVAMDADGDFVITWQSGQDGDGSGVYAQRYNAAGVIQGGEFQVNAFIVSSQRDPAVAMDADGDFVVTWASDVQDGSFAGVYARVYNAAGVVQGAEFQVNTFTTDYQTVAAVAMDADGDFVITWQSNLQDGSNSGVYAQRYSGSPDTSGPWVTGVFVAGDTHLIEAGERLVTSVPQLLIAFSESLETAGPASVTNLANWQLTLGGVDVTSRIIDITFGKNINTKRYEATLTFDSALTAGAYVLSARDAIKDRSANPLDGDFDGIPGGDFQRAFSIEPPVALGAELPVNTFTTGSQRDPAVAMDGDGDFVVTWQSLAQDGSGYGVYAQRYNAAGVAQGGEFQVNTFTTDRQRDPAVAMDADGDFVITWMSYLQDPSGYGVYAQRYNAAGVAQGGEFQVNTYTTNQQRNSAVAMDADGDFVIAWQSFDQDGSYYGGYAQRYNAAGVAQGAEFQVNTFTTSFQSTPAVAMDADGDFVITWQSLYQDGSGDGVYAQRYNAAGVVQGGELQVNTFTTGSQSLPAVAMDVDGDFVITWHSAQDGSGNGVYARRYNAAGVAQGGEFQVNTFTTGAQRSPAVAMDGDGDFVITWQSSQDGSGYGIYAQRYEPNQPPTTSGIAPVRVLEDAVDTVIDLWLAFEDATDPDSALTYTLERITNPGLFSAVSIGALTGLLTLDYAPDANGSAEIFVRATDTGGLFVQTAFRVTVEAVNDAPTAVDDLATTDEEMAVSVNVLANDTDIDGDALTVFSVGSAADGTVVNNGDGTVTYTPNLNFNGTDSFTYTIRDGGGSDTATVTVTVNAVTDELVVTLLTPTSSGFIVQFNRALDTSVLNLYDTQSGGLGAADATLVGASVGPVRGSLLVDPSLMKATFIATGGLFTSVAADGALPADTYTVTLRSAANGFKDTSANLLDGNGDDVPGDNYVNNFTISSVPAVQVGVPDIARGPGQPVNVPATATGIPIRISNGSGVESVDLTLTYDPALLNVTNVVLGVSIPSDVSLVFNLTTPGMLLVSLSTVSTPLGAGPIDLVTLTAAVPCTAAYKSVHVLDITQVSVNEGLIAALDDDGVHAVAYFGDSTGNGGYSGLDGQRVQRVVVALDSGFLAYPLVDPVVISDITGNGSLSGLDGTRIQQEVVGIDRPEIPPLPVCPSTAVGSTGMDSATVVLSPIGVGSRTGRVSPSHGGGPALGIGGVPPAINSGLSAYQPATASQPIGQRPVPPAPDRIDRALANFGPATGETPLQLEDALLADLALARLASPSLRIRPPVGWP